MDAEEWHRCVEEKLDASWQPGALAEKVIPPCAQQQETAGEGVKEAALRHEHREEKVLPCEVGLEVLELPRFQNSKACQASI